MSSIGRDNPILVTNKGLVSDSAVAYELTTRLRRERFVTPMLISQSRFEVARHRLNGELRYLWALLSTWVAAFVNKLPSAKERKAISPIMTFALVAIIIVCGALIVFFVAFYPGTSTSTYP